MAELFQFRNIGLPLPGHWSTQCNGARFGTDYLSRTAMGKANILVNTSEEISYFYQDLDEHGERLDGSHSYAVTFSAGPFSLYLRALLARAADPRRHLGTTTCHPVPL